MPRGQFYTVFTFGFATAIGLMGIALGLLVYGSAEAWACTYIILGAKGVPQSWLEPSYVGLAVAGSAVFTAYWIVRIQQAVVKWSGDRLSAQLDAEYRATAQAQCPEYADEFIRQKALAMLGEDGRHFNLFGRDHMLHAIAAAGVRRN
jgi:hypothetical protein